MYIYIIYIIYIYIYVYINFICHVQHVQIPEYMYKKPRHPLITKECGNK